MKILFAFIFCASAFASTCDEYKMLVDKNVSPSTDKTCKSFHYYFSLKGKKGEEDAKKCAYRELADGDKHPLSGAGILMMIYANGRGGPRDLDLALKYACLYGGTDEELKARLHDLEILRKEPGLFDICDNVTTPYLEGHCANVYAMKDKEVRDRSLQKIQSTFGVDSQATFKKLLDALANYQKSRLANEIDVSGPDRAKLYIEAREKIQNEFMDKLEKFEKNGNALGGQENEKLLNSYVEGIVSRKPNGKLKPEGIMSTQKDWLKFREAWLAFAKARYPRISSELLKRELTEDRIRELNETKKFY